jgi:hypothetical protein
MPQITLDLSEATELAGTLAFITGWLSGSQQQILADNLAAFAGHPAYGIETFRADLHRFVFLLGISDGEEHLGEPGAMTTISDTARPLDRITRITPNRCRASDMSCWQEWRAS